ncbi:MAG: site-specific integrase [Cyanobacteria bacterium K_Offshore_surface_m2_239]|nr:site-specific integrase [Cyanobacteria bacterium K_Offshore_surface_m2_239]
MAAPSFKEAVDQANQLLARSGTSWRLEARGRRLGLRGPLPPRHGTGQEPLTIQRLSLGLEACEASLPRAFALLQTVREQLGQGTFRWVDWQRSSAALSPGQSRPAEASAPPPAPLAPPPPAPPAPLPPPPELEEAVASFERAFHQDPRRRRFPAGARSTWRAAYKPYLRRLLALGAQRRASLSPELLLAVLESYPLASRSRQQCTLVLGALARQREMPLPADWQELGRGYGLHAARFRPLPSDARILGVVEQIPNPRWRLVYGLMATYGLRNHEVFFCDFSALAPGGDRVLRVLPTSKTGEHQVWPFQPEWVELFALDRLGRDPEGLPPVDTDLRRTSLQRVGQRVSEQFRRYQLPLTPYDLRHAWAVRTIHIGLPDTVAARMMGHSVAIHTRTYHHWITRRDQQQAVDAALARRQAS